MEERYVATIGFSYANWEARLTIDLVGGEVVFSCGILFSYLA